MQIRNPSCWLLAASLECPRKSLAVLTLRTTFGPLLRIMTMGSIRHRTGPRSTIFFANLPLQVWIQQLTVFLAPARRWITKCHHYALSYCGFSAGWRLLRSVSWCCAASSELLATSFRWLRL